MKCTQCVQVFLEAHNFSEMVITHCIETKNYKLMDWAKKIALDTQDLQVNPPCEKHEHM
jgi:hypothetical protein